MRNGLCLESRLSTANIFNRFPKMGIISSSYFYYSNGTTTESESGAQTTKSTAAQKSPRHCPSKANILPLLGGGKYRVGCTDIMVAKRSPDETGVFARIFYPSTSQTPSDTITKPWRPDIGDYIEGLAKYREMSMMKMNFFLDWIVGDKRIPVFWQKQIADEGRFPVIIFSHGISGNRFIYTTLCASMASHGYVVAALEHRDGTCCWTYELERDGEGELTRKGMEMLKLPHSEEEYEMRINQVNKRVAETVRMLRVMEAMNAGKEEFSKEDIVLGAEFNWEQFKNRLAVDQAISIGHSFGGASALAVCATDLSFKCCVVLDGWLYPFERHLYPAIVQPVLMLSASKWQWARNVKRLQHLARQGDGIGKMMFTLKDIVHQSFSDFGFLVPGYVGRYFGVQGDLDPELTGTAMMELILEYLRDPIGSGDRMRQIVAVKYAHFIQEGTDIPQQKLDEIDEEAAETASLATGEEEEDKIAKANEIEAQKAH